MLRPRGCEFYAFSCFLAGLPLAGVIYVGICFARCSPRSRSTNPVCRMAAVGALGANVFFLAWWCRLLIAPCLGRRFRDYDDLLSHLMAKRSCCERAPDRQQIDVRVYLSCRILRGSRLALCPRRSLAKATTTISGNIIVAIVGGASPRFGLAGACSSGRLRRRFESFDAMTAHWHAKHAACCAAGGA